ncbi:hypothetical protein G7Z17_g8521 [Cylindrodendrum hubeiense]|uniref:Uncharacterized protein n=1 Tax=Cylindrodendrum hubeiense TaxID=595255 RepID=A0A9P5LEM0_9HYPO|nr:hypothetical protein G7Z17_g8521 [Cylindrodendrum hubeiense]
MGVPKETDQPDLGEKGDAAVDSELVSEPVPPQKIPFFRGTTFQALVVAALFFSGPGMISALGAVGAGGLKDPLLVNITNGMQYGMNCFFAFFAGVFINVLGVRGALSFGLLCFPVRGAALYCANKYKTVWFMYFASALGGLTSSVLCKVQKFNENYRVVQGAIVLSYPEPWNKGFFISTWYNSLSMGTLLGGIIALAFNTTQNTAGSISPIQKLYSDWDPVGLDWVQGDYWLSIILYIYWQYANDMYQCYVYFLIGTLSNEVEELARYTGILKTVNTAGAALGYGVQVKWNMMGAEALLCGLWFAQIIPTWFVVREVTDEEESAHASAVVASEAIAQ